MKKSTSERPDYYAMKGNIDVEALRTKFSRDLMNNMMMAEKMGVFNVLNDMHYDAVDTMDWMERRRPEEGDPNAVGDDRPAAQFPGYQERIAAAYDEILQQRLRDAKRQLAHSNEAIGSRSQFFMGEGSHVDLSYIFREFQHDGVKKFTAQMMLDLLTKDEILAFMSKIRG